jgi:hypothetical protein
MDIEGFENDAKEKKEYEEYITPKVARPGKESLIWRVRQRNITARMPKKPCLDQALIGQDAARTFGE